MVFTGLSGSQMVSHDVPGLRWIPAVAEFSCNTSFVTRWNSSKNLRQKRPIYIDLAGIPQQCLCKYSKIVDTMLEGFEAELFVVSFCLAGHREFELDD